MKPKILLPPEGDTPEKKSPLASTEEHSRERVYGSENMVMEGDSVESDATEQNSEGFFKIVDQAHEKASSIFKLSLQFDDVSDSLEKEEKQKSEGYFKILDQIQEKASSILKFSLYFDDVRGSLEKEEERLRAVQVKEKEIGLIEESISRRLSVLEEKEIESDLILVIEATIMRLVLGKQSEDLMSEFEGKKEEARRIFESINDKTCELEKAEKDFDLKQRAETERLNLESVAREKELMALEEAIKERTAELKRKEENFELKLKEEAAKLREETDLKRKGLEIKEKTQEKRLKVIELKQVELETRSEQQLIEADSRKRSHLELEPPLFVSNDSDAASLTRQAKRQKSQEPNDVDIEEVVCTDKSVEDPKSITCSESDTRFNDFSKSMSSFAVDKVWALYDPIDDMPRIYAQIREVFSSQLCLQVTLLEPVKTTKEENSILSACGRFQYGDTEIKSHLMFAHEMHHITCANNVIVNPRKGETWALFRDWNVCWNSHPDVHEPPYRYDFVEVISEFDNLRGIAVEYMGRVEGFVSVFKHAAQHGLIKIMISPGEMQRFSHKVASVKLSGEEKEGISAGSFELNPAATPSYDPVLDEVMEMKIQSKDCCKASNVVDQNGSTKDLPIIID